MRNPRLVALITLAVLVFGSLLATGGYAYYLRSDTYRGICAEGLSEQLGLPAEIGRVVPRTRNSREFQNVCVWLPERRDVAAMCASAVLTDTPTPDNPEAYELDLHDGTCEISTRTWLREDYRLMLESGLRPGFDPAGPRQIRFHGMDLMFERDRFRVTLDDATGTIAFDGPELGRATLTCGTFNGYATADPVTLRAEFSPQTTGVRLDHIKLEVPELPIALLGLQDLAGLGIRTGSFSGKLDYSESDTDRTVTVSGQTAQLQLVEFTAALFARPWRGAAPEIEIEELTLVNGRPQRLRFRGVLKGVVLGDILEPWGLAGVGGNLVLRVRAADLSPTGITRFVASGRCDHIVLDQVSQALGWGRMTGIARVVIEDLTIIENHLVAFDAQIIVDQASADELNWIERDLVSEIANRTIGVALPDFLPERFEYTQLGVRLDVRDEILHVFGTHGPHEKTILTVSLQGQEFPIIQEPRDAFDLSVHFDDARGRLAEHLRRHLQDLTPAGAWRAICGPPAPRAPDGPFDTE